MIESVFGVGCVLLLLLYLAAMEHFPKSKPLPEKMVTAETYGLRLYYTEFWPFYESRRERPAGIEITDWDLVFFRVQRGAVLPVFQGKGKLFYYKVMGVGPEAPPWADTICSHRTYGLYFHHIEDSAPCTDS